MKTSFKSLFSAAVIPVAFVISLFVFFKFLGDPSNFMGNNPENSPLVGNYYGIIYKGGILVPVLMTLLLTVLTFSIERFIAIRKGAGKGSVVEFVKKVKALLSANKISDAKSLCEEQRGSVANVVLAALVKYEQMEAEPAMSKDQKIVAIQKDVEESTALELPSLEQNLGILATTSSISTLLGLLGTVLGMIKAFAAMANAGAPDSTALATGISEALINTAFGIGTAAIAIIAYNVYTTKIDKLTHSIDEAGYSIVQSYAANHK